MFITSPCRISYCRQHSKPEIQTSALRKKGNIVFFFLKNTIHWCAFNRLIISAWGKGSVSSALEVTQ